MRTVVPSGNRTCGPARTGRPFCGARPGRLESRRDQLASRYRLAGVEKFDEGVQKLLLLRKRQINEYAHRLDVAGLNRRSRFGPLMAQFVDPA